MSLLFVVPDARFFVTHRMPLALAAKSRGYDVHVGTPRGNGVEQIVAAGLTWHELPFGPMRRKPWSDLQSLIAAIRLYRALRPRIVHHVTFKAVLYGTIAARLNRVPAVINAMTGLGEMFAAVSRADRFWRAIVVALFRTFVRHPRMRLIVQNDDDRRLLIEARAASADRIVLIRGSGVDPDFFRCPERPSCDVPTVLFASRILSTKGIREYVEAARRLRGLARFVVAGDHDRDTGRAIPKDEFSSWIRDGVIEYDGRLDDVRIAYCDADIVCLPSWREGVPKALIEAASCARPIVTTDVPGCRDIVRDGINGLLVPPRNAEALTAALRTLIGDPERRREMGRRGRELVIAEFSLAQVIDETLAVYAAVADSEAHGRMRA